MQYGLRELRCMLLPADTESPTRKQIHREINRVMNTAPLLHACYTLADVYETSKVIYVTNHKNEAALSVRLSAVLSSRTMVGIIFHYFGKSNYELTKETKCCT